MRHLVLSIVACIAFTSGCASVYPPPPKSSPSQKPTKEAAAFSLCNYGNKAECEGSYLQCIWSPVPNQNGKQCFTKTHCSSDRPQEICNPDFGCVYNKDNGQCMSQKLAACKSATAKESCDALHQCMWSGEGKVDPNGVMQHCFGTADIPIFGYRCVDYPKDICANNGCLYDEANHKCLSRTFPAL